MKRKIIISLFVLLGLFGLLFILSLAGIWKVSKAVGAANEPAIVVGQRFAYSKLVKPDRYDIIIFKRDDPFLGENLAFQYRLIGLPGDKIEFRNGSAFVNGDSIDQKLVLKHMYAIDHETFSLEKDRLNFRENELQVGENDSVYINLLDSNVFNQKLPARRMGRANATLPDSLFEKQDPDRSIDDFGPIVVPPNSFFVLGDNRDFSSDSRYIRFVTAASLAGTVVWKF